MQNFVFGLDFGTSKTALTFAQMGGINPQVVDVCADSGSCGHVSTCTLRDRSSVPSRVHVGADAAEQYLIESRGRQERFDFFSNFKPHIFQSARQRAIALAFLKELRRTEPVSDLVQRHPGESVVAMGCPAAWFPHGADGLLQLLGEAEFPPAVAIPEPVAAAFYFVGTGLAAHDFGRDLVVLDWGAGKFDMTAMRAGRLEFSQVNSWGSSLFGGRLFDDLFYQWLLDMLRAQGRHADLQRLTNEPVLRAILRNLTCREIKEAFSRDQRGRAADQAWTWGKILVPGFDDSAIKLGNFTVASTGELDERMRSYTASEEMRNSLDLAFDEARPEEMEFADALREGRPVDLKAWGARLVETGLQKLKVGNDAIGILVGGSCHWQWFDNHVRGIAPFAGRSSSVRRDDRPELTIARGLARLHAVGSYNKQLIREIEAKRELLAMSLVPLQRELLESLSNSLAAETKSDDRLRQTLSHVLKDLLGRAQPGGGHSRKGLFAKLWRIFRGYPNSGAGGRKDRGDRLHDLVMRNPSADAIRPEVETCIEQWLIANEPMVARLAERFSVNANRRVTMELKKYIDAEIGGLVERTIEFAGATGETPFEHAVHTLGGRFALDRTLVTRVVTRDRHLSRHALNQGAAADTAEPLEQEAAEATRRFLELMPVAIRQNILNLQAPDAWARQTIDDLVKALRAPLAAEIGTRPASVAKLMEVLLEHCGDAPQDRPKDRQESSTSTGAEPQSDHVNCSIFAPARPQRGRQIHVQALLHRVDQFARAIKMALEVDGTANRKAFAALSMPVNRGAAVALFLEIPALEITMPFQEVVWQGEPVRVAYLVSIPLTAHLGLCRCNLHVMIEGVPVGEIAFDLDIKEEAEAKSRSADATERRPSATLPNLPSEDEGVIEPVTVDAVRYTRAFISYSRKDVQQVLLYAEALENCGIELLFDLTSIEPGAEWEHELDRMIENADVFYLMWSTNAAHSHWVDKETRGAVARNNNDPRRMPRIRPVAIEQPMPNPPDHLSRFQFNSKWLALRTATKVPLFSRPT